MDGTGSGKALELTVSNLELCYQNAFELFNTTQGILARLNTAMNLKMEVFEYYYNTH